MSETPAGRLVREVLDEYGAMTRKRLRELLGDATGPRAAGVRALHQLMSDYPERGGRAMRAGLCVATARAFGGDPRDAIDSAAALELLHNAFLVHDDIEDDSEHRRGRPTLHRMHGIPMAIHVGDALAVLAFVPLIANLRTLGHTLGLRILDETQRMARETVEGQAMELWWRESNETHVTEDDYLELILKKTCWYSTLYPIRVGALIGSRDRVEPERFTRFGFFVGAAFQIQDDLLNLVGDPERYGKELNGDILEGKRTLMLIHLLTHASLSDRDRLCALLGRSRAERTEADVLWVREKMDEHGSIEHAREVAHGLAGAAQHEFEGLFGELPPSRDRDFLAAMTTWALERA
jgi:geranylgeranyl diphosphate synthase type II